MDPYTRNVITVEDPIEALLPQASQIEINPKAGVTFAKALRSILRQDPDVICVGEIRDEETAEIGLRAAQTGHLVLATIHCESNAAALVRLLDLGVSPLLLSSGLGVLITQRLLRLLCTHCKRPVELNKEQVEFFRKNGISCKEIYQAGACEHCGKTGYYGRTAICDVLPITDQLRDDIVNKTTLISEWEDKGAKADMSKLRKQGLGKVASGATSFDELKRVVG
jgi:type II secretory ATPase GspE/PulE/Tfp pilus assembly ATPase PilB-like protein